MSEREWKRRARPRTTCDQCGRDYTCTPDRCVTVLIDHPLEGETICVACATKIGITGCRHLHWGDRSTTIEYVLGTTKPPQGWKYKPTADAILRALSSGPYALPPTPAKPTRLDFELSL